MVYNCSNCGIEIKNKVYEYSKENFARALCRDCQKLDLKEVKGGKKIIRKNYSDFNMIKGRIAEALIEQLFLKLKYRVYRYGMENTIPGIMELLGKVKDEVSNVIKRMPDFVIQAPDGKAYFVEVKFRSSEEFSIKNIPKNYPFENAFFVLVSKKHIKCLSYKDLKEGKKITPISHNYLGNIKEFDTDKEIIKDFCDYAVKFFEGV